MISFKIFVLHGTAFLLKVKSKEDHIPSNVSFVD